MSFRFRASPSLWVVAVVLASVGCSGSSAGDDGSATVADFVGRWDAVSNTGTNSCTGDFENVVDYEIELRAGTASDLEFIEYSAVDPTEIACRQRFDVENGAAVLAGKQTCNYLFDSSDPETGEPIELTNPVIYKDVRITLTDADGLLEIGNIEVTSMDTGERCSSSYRATYVRN